MSLFGPIIVSTEGVKAARDRLLAEAMSVDSDVQKCGALDANTRASWGLFYTTIVDLARQDVPFIGTDQFSVKVKDADAALQQWQVQLGSVCALSAPILVRTAPDPSVSALLQGMQYVVVAAGIIGAAYSVGKLVELAELIPHKSGK
jgi:hypothetical protein